MPVAIGDLTVTYSAMLNRVLRRKTWIWDKLDNSWQGELQSARTVKIPTYVETGAAQETTEGSDRGADWTADKDTTIAHDDFTINKWFDRTHEILEEDEREVRVNLMARQLNVDAYQYGQVLDGLAWTALRTQGVAAGNVLAQEAAGTYDPGDLTDSAIQEAQYNRAIQMIANMHDANAIGMEADSTTGMPEMPCIVSTPRWMLMIQQYLVSKGYVTGWSQLAKSEFEKASSPGMQPLTFRHLNCEWVGSNIAQAYPSGGATVTPVIGFLRDTITVARRPPVTQMLTPETNQTAPNYAIRMRMYANTHPLNPDHAWSAHAKHA